MDWALVFAGISAAATIVTAAGVGIAAYQVRESKARAQTDFEDDLAREYRSIIRDIPARAFIAKDERVSDDELNAFFRYFDLSNEQLYLADQHRVSPETVEVWKRGIRSNAELPMFSLALKQLCAGLPQSYWQYLTAELSER